MNIKKIHGYVIHEQYREKGRSDSYAPPLVPRNNYYYWFAEIDDKTCTECINRHKKIFSITEEPDLAVHPHLFCRCERVSVKGVVAGTATKDGTNGADWWLKNTGKLPDYYINKEDLEKLGWSQGDRPSQFAPGKMATMGIYENKDNFLPQTVGRIWYEADINYTHGRRNLHRILWSNDGLVFVTYDHYLTFYEIF